MSTVKRGFRFAELDKLTFYGDCGNVERARENYAVHQSTSCASNLAFVQPLLRAHAAYILKNTPLLHVIDVFLGIMNELKSADQLVDDYKKFSNKRHHFEDSSLKWNVRCNACLEPLASYEAAKVIPIVRPSKRRIDHHTTSWIRPSRHIQMYIHTSSTRTCSCTQFLVHRSDSLLWAWPTIWIRKPAVISIKVPYIHRRCNNDEVMEGITDGGSIEERVAKVFWQQEH